MNISITNICNRRCEYCFQREWYLSKKTKHDDTSIEMSPNDFRDILSWFFKDRDDRKGIKLLGGEPLMHSKIFDLLDISKEFDSKLCLISNISVDTPIVKKIADDYIGEEKCIDGLLINSDYPLSQREVFLENFKTICKTNIKFSISTTLLPNSADIMKSAERIRELIKIYKQIRNETELLRIRLAPCCPNQTSLKFFKFYDFSKDIVDFFNYVWQEGLTQAGFDCPINYCELSESAIDAFRKSGIRIKTCSCDPVKGCPFDVLVDGSIIWCSSADFIKLDNWRDYPSYKDAQKAMSEQWRKYWVNTTVKCDYTKCEKFNPALCHGLCAGKNRFIENMQKSNKIVIIPSHH